MTEDDQVQAEPMTATDVQIQELRNQMDAMRADYDKQLKSYQDANRQLFSMLNHPVQDAPAPVQEPTAKGFDMDLCAKAFYNRIDRKQEE